MYENTSVQGRTGTIDVGGHIFTISQAGTGECSYIVSPQSVTASGLGGVLSVSVKTDDWCSWTAASQAAWIDLQTSEGTGSDTVSFSVEANTGGQIRQGGILVAGNTVVVTQEAAACSFDVQPASLSAGYTGGQGDIRITASDVQCSWTATSGEEWIFLSPVAGAGSADVQYTLLPNAGDSARVGTVQIAGQTVSVSQSGFESNSSRIFSPDQRIEVLDQSSTRYSSQELAELFMIPSDFETELEARSFEARVTGADLAEGLVFGFDVLDLDADAMQDLRLYKLFPDLQGHALFTQTASPGTGAGTWWLETLDGSVVGLQDPVNADTVYTCYFVLDDNGFFDLDDRQGFVRDPVLLGRVESGSGSGSSGGGCLYDPNSSSQGVLWFVFLAVFFLVCRRKGKV